MINIEEFSKIFIRKINLAEFSNSMTVCYLQNSLLNDRHNSCNLEISILLMKSVSVLRVVEVIVTRI